MAANELPAPIDRTLIGRLRVNGGRLDRCSAEDVWIDIQTARELGFDIAALDISRCHLFLNPVEECLSALLLNGVLILFPGIIVFKHLDQVDTELGFNRFADLSNGQGKCGIFERCDHGATTKPAQITTAGGIAQIVAIFGGEFGEIFAI